MSDDPSITPRMRNRGWNLHLYLFATTNLKLFAGLYQDPETPFLTFRDLVDELRLSFRDDENWNGIAFGLDQRHRSNGFPLFVTERELDTVIPSLPQPNPVRRAVVRYHVILKYHGRIATIPQNVDRDALAHHYEMACIENMTAMMPIRVSTTLPSEAGTGTSAPPNSPI